MTGVTHTLTPWQIEVLARYRRGEGRYDTPNANLVRRGLVESAGHGDGYTITRFGVALLAEREWDGLLHRAGTEPINLDISDYSDEWCDGFQAGQRSVLEEIAFGRLTLPAVTPVASGVEERPEH